ncbi:unnamed protein product [Linum tenue]|uniref:Phosphate transporter n=1 Tax=Linum tenue TaxID=586396 RepID=A0AAV0NME2_9ROSI|nr:unnamed protein product [Linum tenue]
MAKVLADVKQLEEVKVEKVGAVSEASGDKFGLFSREFLKRHGLHLLATTSTWFLLDIAYYSQNLFQKDIFTAIHWIPPAATMNAIHEVFKVARAQTIIALCGTVPGYWVTVALIDKMHYVGFLVFYGLTFFFANFGPNATTFVVPAEIFPARLRSTCHGISAAAGKAGAIVGAFGFLYASQSKDPAKVDKGYSPGIGMQNSLFVMAVINALGIGFTLLVPESNGKSLEELSGENEAEEQAGTAGDDASAARDDSPV